MDKKKLTFQVAKPVNKLPLQDTAIKLVELSDEALSQVCGGGKTTGTPGAKYKGSVWAKYISSLNWTVRWSFVPSIGGGKTTGTPGAKYKGSISWAWV